MSAKIFGFVAIGLASLALVLQIVALALPAWYKVVIGSTTVRTGLWNYCSEVSSVSTCQSIENPADDLKATRAMEILGLMLMVGVIVLTVLKLFVMKDKDILALIGAGVGFGAGLFALIGIIIFATNISDEYSQYASLGLEESYAVGFILCIIAAIFVIAAGVLLILVKLKGDK